MPSTYTLNNGIELIGTGEQSGTWGDTTNTNLQLLDTALDGQVTVALSSAGSSGSPNNLPVSDGTTSNGRNRLVIFSDSSDLGATAYVQLTPNDSEKIIYVRNSLSGSRSIALFQGTYNASNDYEVPAGTTAVVFFNGAGTGAVAANVFNNAFFDSLRLGGVSVTAILDEDDMSSDSATALATQQSIKKYVDDKAAAQDTLAEVLANGNTTGGTDIAVSANDDITFTDSSKAIFGAGSDLLQIYRDSSGAYVKESGSGSLYIQGTDVRIQNASGENILKGTSDGAVTLYYDNAPKLATTTMGADIGTIGTSVSATLRLKTDGDNDALALNIEENSGTEGWGLGVNADGDLKFYNSGTGTSTGLSAVTFLDDDTVNFYSTSTTDQFVIENANTGAGSAPDIVLYRNSASPADGDVLGRMDFRGKTDSGTVRDYFTWYAELEDATAASAFGSLNLQTSVGTTYATKLTVLGDGKLGLGSTNPSTLLQLEAANNSSDVNNALRFKDTDTAVVADQKIGRIEFETADSSNPGVNLQIDAIYGGSGAGSELVIKTGTAGSLENRLFIQDSETVFNDDNADNNFRVASVNQANMLVLDAAADYVGIGSATNYSAKLTVQGSKTSSAGIPNYQLTVVDDTAMAAGTGGAINFWGNYTTAGSKAEGASIEAYKSNGTSGNYQYGMWLKTRTHGGSMDDRLFMDQVQTVFNETGADTDFRIESDSNDHMLFVDAGQNRVSIGSSSFNYGTGLTVHGNEDGGTPSSVFLRNSGTSGGSGNRIECGYVTGYGAAIRFSGNPSSYRMYGTYFERITGDGPTYATSGEFGTTGIFKSYDGAVFNESSKDVDFRVESDSNANAIFVDAQNDRRGFGTGAPEDEVHIKFDRNNSGLIDTVGSNPNAAGGLKVENLDDTTNSYAGLFLRSYSGDIKIMSKYTGTANQANLEILQDRGSGIGNMLEIGQSTTVFNEDSKDQNFRVESNASTHGIYLDADDDTLCFFTGTTSSSLPSGGNFKRDGQNNGWMNIGHTTAAGDGFSYIQFMYNSGRIGQAVQSGTTGVTYQTTSDYRLKENAVAITSATERVKQLNPIRFNFISEPDRTIDGFLAHEVQAIVPEAVSGTKDEVDSNGRPEYQGLDTSRLVPVLVATIKELEARITALENA